MRASIGLATWFAVPELIPTTTLWGFALGLFQPLTTNTLIDRLRRNLGRLVALRVNSSRTCRLIEIFNSLLHLLLRLMSLGISTMGRFRLFRFFRFLGNRSLRWWVRHNLRVIGMRFNLRSGFSHFRNLRLRIRLTMLTRFLIRGSLVLSLLFGHPQFFWELFWE